MDTTIAEQTSRCDKIAAAMVKVQSQIKGALKDSTNPHLRSKYADLASVWDACRAALTANGIAVIQCPRSDGTKVEVETILLHESGQSIESSLTLIPVKNDPQGIGSCITYARRYGLASMVGVTAEDDDGAEASGRTHAPPPTPTQAPHRQASGGPAATPPPAAPKKPLTVEQRWKVAVAKIRTALSAQRGDELIADLTAKYAGPGEKVPEDKREALLMELELAAFGPPKEYV